ncbi:MAG: PIN domain-containing protein [Nitrospirae bacterium]|nr:PIN domain-containing protein [Nitrospirota bacterium]
MAKINLLVDTDIFIDYFNSGLFVNILENKVINIYYSVITRKELLSKGGLKASERDAIIFTLKGYREIKLNQRITSKYSAIRNSYPHIEKEDAIIAATAIVRGLPLMTRNYKHFAGIEGLHLVRKGGIK